MWLVLAVTAFLLGQVYLLRCLRKVDRFLDRQTSEAEPEKQILSIAFSGPKEAEGAAELLKGFSGRYPDVEMILRTGRDVAAAVCDGSAAVGFLPTGQNVPRGLNRISLPEREVIWKSGGFCAPADVFVRYLRECGDPDSGNAESFVV